MQNIDKNGPLTCKTLTRLNFTLQVIPILTSLKFCSVVQTQPFLKRENLDSSKLKEFAGDNFRLDKKGRNFFKWVENTAGKGEIARYEQYLLFQRCFQKTCTADT